MQTLYFPVGVGFTLEVFYQTLTYAKMILKFSTTLLMSKTTNYLTHLN